MSTKVNLVVEQGATFTTTLNLTNNTGDALALSGYSAQSALKRWYTSTNAISIPATVNANNGTITLTLSANATKNLYSGRYVYDVNTVDPSGGVVRVVEGIITITPAVTASLFTTNTVNSNS